MFAVGGDRRAADVRCCIETTAAARAGPSPADASPPGASKPESNMVVLILFVLFAVSWCAFIVWRLRSHPRHLAALGVASFSAALSGLVFAVTVSLSVYYYQHSQATIELARIEQQHEDEARARIVTLTKRELSDNLAVIKSTKAAPNHDQAFTIMIRSPLKTEFLEKFVEQRRPKEHWGLRSTLQHRRGIRADCDAWCVGGSPCRNHDGKRQHNYAEAS
jgi:hypothetical protein